MARRASNRAQIDGGDAPKLIAPVPRSYFEVLKKRMKAEQPPSLPIRLERRTKEQIQAGLRMLANGWNGETEAAISVPREMFLFEGTGTRFYSATEKSYLSALLSGLGAGKLYLPETPYGIILYETASTINFVLFDATRRIVVRDRLLCYHNDPPQRDWSIVKNHVDAAIALAGTDDAKAKGLFAVYDGTLKLMCPEKQP
jgi:hypothetical protein